MWAQLLICALLAGGLVVCLYLFITLKRDMAAVLRRVGEGQKRLEVLEGGHAGALQAIQAVGADLREFERQAGMLVAPEPARSGLNISKRTQVIRLYRSGQDSAGIATVLSLPRAEVDLLIKVHKMIVEQV